LRELPVHEDAGSIAYRRSADAAVKQAAERTDALKSDLETDIGHRSLTVGEHLLGFGYAPLSQVLMRGPIESLSEEPEEMISRQTGFAGDLIEIEREVVAVIHQFAGSSEPSIGIHVCFQLVTHVHVEIVASGKWNVESEK
jgi:hypothetical protein